MNVRKITRREMLLGTFTAGCCGAIWYAQKFEPGFIELSYKSLALSSTPPSPIRLLHLSDLHLSAETPLPLIEEAVDLGLSSHPDVIAVTGDFITSTLEHDARYAEVLRRLSNQAPTFAVLGNHDGGDWAKGAGGYRSNARVRRLLDRAAIQQLENETHVVRARGQNLTLVGLGDLWSGTFLPDTAFAATKPDSRNPVIVLSHNPDSKDSLKAYKWELMLSGHTHGGQLIVPFTGATPFAPVKDLRYVDGLRPWEDRHIHVTRGIGSILGIRFNCRPEVSVIDLV